MSFIVEKYNLHIEHDRAYPYRSGSQGSIVPEVGTELINVLPRTVGIIPVSKQTLNRICVNDTHALFR